MAREKFPSDETDRLMVRFPAGMRERIRESADANKRSMNAEIISRLEESFDLQGRILNDEDLEDLLQKPTNAYELTHYLNNISLKHSKNVRKLVDAIEAKIKNAIKEAGLTEEEVFFPANSLRHDPAATTPSTPTPKREKAK